MHFQDNWLLSHKALLYIGSLSYISGIDLQPIVLLAYTCATVFWLPYIYIYIYIAGKVCITICNNYNIDK